MTIWDEVLASVREALPEDDFRRWFGATAYASDSGDQITVWVPSEAVRRHIVSHYQEVLDDAFAALGRSDTLLRLVVAGVDDDDEE